jgi:hypothetical protein
MKRDLVESSNVHVNVFYRSHNFTDFSVKQEPSRFCHQRLVISNAFIKAIVTSIVFLYLSANYSCFSYFPGFNSTL